MIVLKFGGSSLGNLRNVNNCLAIIKKALPQKPVVVVSAHGNTTDALLKAAQAALEGRVEVEGIRSFHLTLIDSLRLERSLLDGLLGELETILKGVGLVRDLSPKVRDHILSFGERMSSVIVAAALNAMAVPARAVNSYDIGFVTESSNGAAAPLPGIEEELARSLKSMDRLAVVTGFIGRDREGNITTIGRNGSDYTAAIVGGAVEAQEVQIWTDVDGVMTADPTVDQRARNLPVLSLAEASELSYYGAEVLHTGTLIPAVEKNIPIRVANTNRPENPGTLIQPRSCLTRSLAKAVVYKEDVALINVVSPRLMSASGLLQFALNKLTDLGIGVHIVATSVSSISLVTDGTYPAPLLNKAVSELSKFWSVKLEEGRAIVCVVGEELQRGNQALGRIFTALAQAGIKARMVAQSASEINIAFLVNNSEIEPAVKALHQLLLEEQAGPAGSQPRKEALS